MAEVLTDFRYSHYQNLTTQNQPSGFKTVLSDLDSMFRGFVVHCVEQQ